MNAAETIQTAIDKLETLRGATTPGPWIVKNKSLHGTQRKYHPLLDAGDFAGSSETFENVLDAELIVTLQRTIDAQLEHLRHALARGFSKVETGGVERVVWSHERDALSVAEAILGT